MRGNSTGATAGIGPLGTAMPAWRLALGLFLVALLGFAVLPIQPLYFDNQNTKLLYGLAKAGFGRLSDDWLIAQGSVLPIFDALVYLTYAFVGAFGFYLWLFAAFATYTVSVFGIARLAGVTKPELFGPDGRWFLPVFGLCWIGLNGNNALLKAFEGVAVQYINGGVFETQIVGVLALLGLLLFRLKHTGWAVVLIVAAAWVHAPYSIAGLILLLGMALARWRHGGEAVSLPPMTFLGGVVGCLAAAGFSYSLLQPSDPSVQAEATRIIAEIRIPYHAIPRHWLDDSDTWLKLLALLVAIRLAWRDPLSSVMLVAVACVVALTTWVAATYDLRLALAGPWRVSAIIVPAANAILLGRLLQLAAEWTRDNARRRWLALVATALVLTVTTILGEMERFARMRDRADPAYFAWVRDNARDGDIFLTPPMHHDFRLATGQPQYVTRKTHPYRGSSVLEWYERLQRAFEIAGGEPPACDLVGVTADQGVTHIVRDSSAGGVDCPGWHDVYDDGSYVISSRRP